MAKKLFIGGLAYSVRDDELKDFFGQVGTVLSASVVMDRETNRSKGFAFVEYEEDADALKAIEELNGKEISGRPISVSEARPREDKPRFGGGNGGNRNFGGGGNGGSFRQGNRY